MSNKSGGGGSNVNRRKYPEVRGGSTFDGSKHSGVTRPGNGRTPGQAQRDNRRRFGEDVYDPAGKVRRVESQVGKADQAAARNRDDFRSGRK